MVAVVVVVRSEPNLTPEETAGTTNLFLLFFCVFVFVYVFFNQAFAISLAIVYYLLPCCGEGGVVARAAWWPGQHSGQGSTPHTPLVGRMHIYIYNTTTTATTTTIYNK